MSPRARIREEDGFSLIELLTAMALGSLVLTMLMIVSLRAMASSTDAQNRVETGQTARLAMDRVTQLLDSQTCLLMPHPDTVNHPDDVIGVPPIVAADTNSVTFYADQNASGTAASPDKYTITYSPTAKTLTVLRYDAIGTEPRVSYATAPSRTQVLASNVLPARDTSKVVQPIFRYSTFPPAGSNTPTPLTAATLSSTDVGKVIRVDVQFQPVARLHAVEDANHSNSVQGESILQTADPDDSTVCP
jgi:prepilin-type N-terminal cleavage/methylation domain-containing protein